MKSLAFSLLLLFCSLGLSAQSRFFTRQAQATFAQAPQQKWGGGFQLSNTLGRQSIGYHMQYHQYLYSSFYASAEIFVSGAFWRHSDFGLKEVTPYTRGNGFGIGYVWTGSEEDDWTYDLSLNWRYQWFDTRAEDRLRDTSTQNGLNQPYHTLEIKSEEVQLHFHAMKNINQYHFGFGLSAIGIRPYWQSSWRPMLAIRNGDPIYADQRLPEIELNQTGLILEPSLQGRVQMNYGFQFMLQCRASISVLPSDMDPVPFSVGGGIRWQWGRLN